MQADGVRIAVLIACHNRREHTLRCLTALMAAKIAAAGCCGIDPFLVDDASTDGTAAAVRNRFPDVRVLAGDGNLFWCGGMRAAWASAAEGDYDGYLWLNDDVAIEPDGISRLVSLAARRKRGDGAVIAVGSTRAVGAENACATTYGGLGPGGVLPASKCERQISLFNGNIVLVSRQAFKILGGLSSAYTHGLADIDYGVRAQRAKIPVWLAAGSLGSCAANATPRWKRRDLSVVTRLRELHRPTGCPPWQLARLVWSNGGWWFPWSVAKLYGEALFPKEGGKTQMTHGRNPRRSLPRRIVGRIWRMIFGDRVLLSRTMADPMWHLEQARRRISGGEIVVRFDNLDADITLDARSDLAARAIGQGAYEPELLAAIPELVGGGDAINVGANVGVVAIVIRRAMAAGTRLLCVEPIDECVARLSRNLERAQADQGAIVRKAFATDKPVGTQEMWTVPGRPEYSSGGRLVHPSVAATEHLATTVPAIRLDDVVSAEGIRPTCIVMDCEGGELNALRGAKETLAALQPTIIMEFDPPLLQANGGSADSLLHFLADLGYHCITLAAVPADVDATFAGTVVAVPEAQTDAAVGVIRSVCASCGY